MEEFLTRFDGCAPIRKAALYMRAPTPCTHPCHEVVGIAYHAASGDDLKQLAKAPGASAVETSTSRRRQAGAADRGRTATRSRSCTASPQWRDRHQAPSSTPARALSRAGELMQLPKGART